MKNQISNWRTAVELKEYRSLRDELEKDYFLVGKGAFIGGFIACLVIVAGVGWTSVRTALSTSAEGAVLERLEEGQRAANALIDGSSAVPFGAVILIDNSSACPQNYSQVSDLGIMTLRDSDRISDDMIALTHNITRESTHLDTHHWDRRQFKACLFKGL